MANAQRGEASLKVGDTVYTLQYGWNAIAKIETVSGLTSNEIAGMIQPGKFNAGVFRAVLWGMLQKHHSDLDLEAVGDLMDEVEAAALSTAVREAMERSSLSGGDKENPRKASRSTGKTS